MSLQSSFYDFHYKYAITVKFTVLTFVPTTHKVVVKVGCSKFCSFILDSSHLPVPPSQSSQFTLYTPFYCSIFNVSLLFLKKLLSVYLDRKAGVILCFNKNLLSVCEILLYVNNLYRFGPYRCLSHKGPDV